MRRTYVHPSGNPEATLAVCGEQPGIQEIRGNPPRPFIGPAGHCLDECLGMVKLIRRDLYLTNVIKDLDAPLAHYITIDYKKHKFFINPDGYLYINELRQELEKLHLNAIVALGNVALIALTSRMGIGKWRGSVIESTLVKGLKVIPAYHPATVIAPKFNFLNKPLICEDLKRAAIESEYPEIRRTPRKCYIRPRFDQAIYALNHAYESGLRGQTITVDLEIINREVDCFSLGWSPTHSICIPLRCQQGDYFNPEEELEILLLLAKIIQEEKISKSGANFIFDLQFLFRKYGMRPRGEIHCTQIAQKISLPDYPAGLDFVCVTHTDIPYYKADGKEWMRMGAGTWENWWEYNAMDSIVPQDSIPKQLEILRTQGNIETYNRQRKLIEPLLYMGEKGIKVDVQGMLAYKEEQQKLLDDLASQLNSEVGYEINYNSPAQLMKYFYGDCKIKAYKKKTADGSYNETSDVDALKRIFRQNVKGSKAARIMLDIRGLSKRISTYLNIGKVDPDGRYRSSYKPVGAETGRLSSGETIFGTGGNQQNIPNDLLRFFLFDEGYMGYSLDLSQIENRIVAYVGGVIAQIEAFENGIDLHKMTASVIFDKSIDQITTEDNTCPLGDGRQSERYWGKKGNHSLNYDVGYKTFALKYEITETEAKWIIEKIHKGYPQIRGGYQLAIQNMLKHDRTVTNLFGRTRIFLGPVYPSYTTPLSMCQNTYREAYAQMAQSTCADKMNEQGVEFVYYNQQWFEHVELLAQIHDSIVFQIPLSIPWTTHAEIILRIKQSLETPLTWHDISFKTPSDLAIGFNMSKANMIELKSKNISESPSLFAEKLKESYDKLQVKKG